MCGHRNTMVFPEFGIKIKTDRQTNQRKLKKKQQQQQKSSAFISMIKKKIMTIGVNDWWHLLLISFSFPGHKKQSHPQIWCAWSTQSEMVCLKVSLKPIYVSSGRERKKPYPVYW